jgi:hypothetical protein
MADVVRDRLASTAEGILGALVTVRRLLVVIVVLLVAGCGLAWRVNTTADSSRRTAEAAKRVADVVESCTTPAGKCAQEVAAREAAEAEMRRAELDAALSAIRASVDAGISDQRAAADQQARTLLAAVNDALRRLDDASADRADLQAALDDARRQLATLAAEQRRLAEQAEAEGGPPAGPPDRDICRALGSLGALFGC